MRLNVVEEVTQTIRNFTRSAEIDPQYIGDIVEQEVTLKNFGARHKQLNRPVQRSQAERDDFDGMLIAMIINNYGNRSAEIKNIIVDLGKRSPFSSEQMENDSYQRGADQAYMTK